MRLTPDQLQHKKCARRLIRAVGGIETAATFCRVSDTQLSDYQNPNILAFMPSDVIADLEANTVGQPDHPVMTRHLARLAGDLLVKAPCALAGPWGRTLRELSKDFGEVSGTICDCLGDDATPGEITGEEVREHDLIGKLDQLAEIVAEMRAQAVAAVEKGRGQ